MCTISTVELIALGVASVVLIFWKDWDFVSTKLFSFVYVSNLENCLLCVYDENIADSYSCLLLELLHLIRLSNCLKFVVVFFWSFFLRVMYWVVSQTEKIKEYLINLNTNLQRLRHKFVGTDIHVCDSVRIMFCSRRLIFS